MAKKGQHLSEETKQKISNKARLRAEAISMYGNIKLVYSEKHNAYIPNELIEKPKARIPEDSIAPHNVRIEVELLQRLDDEYNSINKVHQYDENFYPYRDKSKRSRGVKGLHGGTINDRLFTFMSDKLRTLDEQGLEEYVEHLEKNRERISELIDWNNTKVKYTEDAEEKVTELINLLNEVPISLEEAQKHSDLWGEIS